MDEQLELASKVKGLTGIALDFPTQVDDPLRMKEKLANLGLRTGMLEIDMYSHAEWKFGSLTSADPKKRKEAVSLIKRGIDAAIEMEAADVQLWLGQDGYEYPFQADFSSVWNNLLDGLNEVASYRPEMKITVEYKAKEPRARCFIPNAGVALALVNAVGKPHVGITLDMGHALMAGENPAESATLLHRFKRLFHLHINDNYRDWDHDMIPGSVNFWDTLEFFYWLRKIEYDGWFGIDIYPYREDGTAAISQTIKYIHRFYEIAGTLDEEKLREYRSADEPLKIMDMLMDRFLK
ncbi:unnamed protein product [Aphanomyces euteiches]